MTTPTATLAEHRARLDGPATIVKFTGDFCAPCKVIHPACLRLAEYYKGIVDYIEIDTLKDTELMDFHELRTGIPAFHVYQYGVRQPELEFIGADEAALHHAFVTVAEAAQKQ